MMRLRAISLALAVVSVASLSDAALSKAYESWPDTPAGWLLTKAERKTFDKLETDAQAEAFIELFWAKRDPDLTTAINEFRDDFELRIEAADLQFSNDKTKGSLTDRGRALILLGPPTAAQDSDAMPGATEESRGFSDRGSTQAWVYAQDRLPEGFSKDNVFFYFAESSRGSNDFQLVPGDSRNRMAFKLMGGAPDRLLLHPDLKEPPRVGLIVGSKQATPGQLAVFSVEPRPWPEGAGAVATEGVLFGSMMPIWIFAELPDQVPVASRAVGRVRSKGDDAELGSFVLPLEPITTPVGRGYELSIPVKPGEWLVDLSLESDEGTLAVTTVETAAEPLPAEGVFLSDFYWGVDIRQAVDAKLGDPFNIGGWHVVPRTTSVYTNKETLAYFCFVVRPAQVVEGKATVNFGMKLFSGERKLSETPTQEMDLSQVGGDLWMFGSSLPLRGFRRAGDFRLELSLEEPMTGVKRSAVVPLRFEATEGAEGAPAGEAGQTP